METLIYSLGVITLCVSAISSITLFNIGSNVIMTNNNKNFFVNIGYIFGLFYMSIVCGMLFTINIPWILLYTIANSSDINHTINVFCAPILKNISNSIEDYSSYKLDHQISSILEERCDEETFNEETLNEETLNEETLNEETSDEELDETDKEKNEETSDEELDENKEADKKGIEEEKVIEEEKSIEEEKLTKEEKVIEEEKSAEVICNLPDSPRDCFKCDRKSCTFGSYFEVENCAGTSSCSCINNEQKKESS